jgi:succinate dehydrogenase/fumarate reductase cytochrome b subunit
MKKLLGPITIFLFLPLITFAQSLQTFLGNFVIVTNTAIVPFLWAIAFLFFVINAFRYFILGSTDKEGQEKARALIIYSVAAFVLITIFFGLVNLIANSIGLEGGTPPPSDYTVLP